MKNTSNQNHSAYIVKLTNVRKHPNADRLKLATVLGCTLVVGLDNTEGQVGLYFQSGLQLSSEFATLNDLVRRKDSAGNLAGGMFEESRRVKALNLRHVKSDGFFTELSTLVKAGVSEKIVKELKEGDYFDVLDGIPICNKWVLKTKASGGVNNMKAAGGKKDEYPMFKKHYDTTQLRFKAFDLDENDHIVVTEKLHGTSQRVGNTIEAIKPKWWQKPLLNLLHATQFYRWRDIVGTRNVILNKLGVRPSGGYYSDVFRDKAAKPFYEKLHNGETVYYEVVGYEGTGRPIMGVCANKLVGKDFVKIYGENTTFSYSCPKGDFDIYVYRITMTNNQGVTIEYNWKAVEYRCLELGVKIVPTLYEGPVSGFVDANSVVTEQTIMEAADVYATGASTIDPTHIKEGIVIRKEGATTPWVAKHKSMEFKILEGIVKPETLMDGVEEES